MKLPELALRQRLFERPEPSPESGRSRWEARPLVALCLRLSMALVPAVAAVLVTICLDQIDSPPSNWPGAAGDLGAVARGEHDRRPAGKASPTPAP